MAGTAGQGGDPLSAGGRRRHRGPHPVPEARRDVGRSNSSSTIAAAPAAPSRAAAVAKAERDGYTIMYDATAHSVNPSLYPSCPTTRSRISSRCSWRRWSPTCWWSTIGGGEDRRRRDRARQGDARRARLGVVGQRHGAAPLARNVPASRRHQAQPHSLSRRRPGAQRPHRRPGEVLSSRMPPPRSATCRGGAQGDRPYRPGPARHAARSAGGGGNAAGLRGL